MLIKVYLSNISPKWTLPKQQALMAEHVPGWPGVSVYRDILPAAKRKAHNRASLVNRAKLLRPTGRPRGSERMYVASLACLAWGVEDFTAVLKAIADRGSTLMVLDIGLEIGHDAVAKTLHEAVEAFTAAKSRATGLGPQEGARISAERRAANAKAAAESIRAEWQLPTKEYPTDELLTKANISRVTANLYLGHRPFAQKLYREKVERRKARAKKADQP